MTRQWPLGPALRPILCLALSVPVTCSAETGDATEAEETVAESTAPPPAMPQIPTGTFVGHIVETMDAADYTYVALERDGERIWAAGPKTVVAIGDEITVTLNMQMVNFTSETLDRTFETIYFVGSLGPGEAAMSQGSADPHAAHGQGLGRVLPGHRPRDALAHVRTAGAREGHFRRGPQGHHSGSGAPGAAGLARRAAADAGRPGPRWKESPVRDTILSFARI